MTERSCDGCAKCCEGWLHGEAYGHAFYKGRPCFFLNKTCSIYDTRPENPCRTFKCSWLAEDTFPHWMKPDLVNIIITKRQVDNFYYYEIVEAGSTIESKSLNWLVQWALNTDNNILYYIEGGVNRIGSQEFLKANL
jgi:hypothetical protein